MTPTARKTGDVCNLEVWLDQKQEDILCKHERNSGVRPTSGDGYQDQIAQTSCLWDRHKTLSSLFPNMVRFSLMSPLYCIWVALHHIISH